MKKHKNKSQKQLDLDIMKFWEDALIDDVIFTRDNGLNEKVLKAVYPDAYERYLKIREKHK